MLSHMLRGLVFEVIPVWWVAMELLQCLKLNFTDVNSVEELNVLAVNAERQE